MKEVRCPNCGTSFVIGGEEGTHTQIRDGINYLIPETIRNENVNKQTKVDARMQALKAAGVDVDKLKNLMENNSSFKDIFASDDPIVDEISKGGFIRNPELFRRWITAQTFRLLKDPNGWTHAVRQHYDLLYVFNQTKRELALLCKLQKKCPNDIRFQFFTLDDLKEIFCQIEKHNIAHDDHAKTRMMEAIRSATSYSTLYNYITSAYFHFSKNSQNFIPRTWLNCFKGAGAYYTLQNIIRTHGLIIPDCKDMNESLERVDVVFKDIIGYAPRSRRWDLLMSLLTYSVAKTNFELKW
jgi:hypothetical protein